MDCSCQGRLLGEVKIDTSQGRLGPPLPNSPLTPAPNSTYYVLGSQSGVPRSVSATPGTLLKLQILMSRPQNLMNQELWGGTNNQFSASAR